MSVTPARILTKNLLFVGKSYFDRAVKPSLLFAQNKETAVIKFYKIANKVVQVCFYGQHIESIFSLALSHRITLSTAEPDLTIHVWDSPGSDFDIMASFDDSLFENDADRENFFGVYVSGEESLSFYDAVTKTAYFWTYDARIVPDWVLGAPFRLILHWFLYPSQIHLVHGAVVGENSQSVLLTARSGSGKSTTSLSCLLSGMDYLADDYVALESTKDSVTAHSLYNSAKLTRKGLNYFPEFKKNIWNRNFSEKEKAVIFLSDLFPGQIKLQSSLKAILIPRFSPEGTRITRASKLAAMLAMAPTTLLQLPLAETERVAIFKDMLNIVPCYFLDLGTDVRSIPAAIKAILRS